MRMKKFLLGTIFALVSFSLAIAQTPQGSGQVGTLGVQNANAVVITGGSINGTTIGLSVPAAGGFTAINVGQSALSTIGDPTVLAGRTINTLIVGTDTAAGQTMAIRKSVNTAAGPGISFAKSRGTQASPLVIVTGDTVGSYGALGFDGTNYSFAGQISFASEGTISTGIVPGNISLQTTNSGGTVTTALKIDSSQRLITTTMPTTCTAQPTGTLAALAGVVNLCP